MPELAEVEHSRRQWEPWPRRTEFARCLSPGRKLRVSFVIRTPMTLLQSAGPGQSLIKSEAQVVSRCFFNSAATSGWAFISGMNGELRRELSVRLRMPAQTRPSRYCGRITKPRSSSRTNVTLRPRAPASGKRRHPLGGPSCPRAGGAYASNLPYAATAKFLAAPTPARPIKAVLLMQEHFPGHRQLDGRRNPLARPTPSRHPGRRRSDARRQTRTSSGIRSAGSVRTAIRIISDDWTYPPDWLFTHRWEAGGECPRCHTKLDRATIGGRTTCWCPQCQPTTTAVAVDPGKVPARRAVGKKGVPKAPPASPAKTAVVAGAVKVAKVRKPTAGPSAKVKLRKPAAKPPAKKRQTKATSDKTT